MSAFGNSIKDFLLVNGSDNFHSETLIRKAIFSAEKSFNAENSRSGSGLFSSTYSRAPIVKTLSLLEYTEVAFPTPANDLQDSAADSADFVYVELLLSRVALFLDSQRAIESRASCCKDCCLKVWKQGIMMVKISSIIIDIAILRRNG
jgi:hypothetical protein